jgi:hypothetical protein
MCVDSEHAAARILKYIDDIEIFKTTEDNIISGKINLIIKYIDTGFMFNDYVVISSNDLFHNNENRKKYKNKFKLGTKIGNVSNISRGDYVVHEAHGIGIYDDIVAVFPLDLSMGTADGGVVRNVIIHITAFSAQAENRLVDLDMLAGLNAAQKRAVLLLERIHRGSSFWLFLCLFYRFFREKSRMQMKSQRIYEAQVVPEASVWYASCRKEVRP